MSYVCVFEKYKTEDSAAALNWVICKLPTLYLTQRVRISHTSTASGCCFIAVDFRTCCQLILLFSSYIRTIRMEPKHFVWLKVSRLFKLPGIYVIQTLGQSNQQRTDAFISSEEDNILPVEHVINLLVEKESFRGLLYTSRERPRLASESPALRSMCG